jgi:hypothetical protein
MQNNCFDYPAQLFIIIFLIPKFQFQKNLKNKTLSTGVPKHPGAHFFIYKNKLFVIENLAKFNKKVIEFPL